MIPNHLPEVRNGISDRMLGHNEFLQMIESGKEGSIDVIRAIGSRTSGSDVNPVCLQWDQVQ